MPVASQTAAPAATTPGPEQSIDRAGKLAAIQQLFDQAKWQEIVDRLGRQPLDDPDLAYSYGTALAQLGRWDRAHTALLEGRRLAPHDSRFPVELGGVAFKQKRYAESAMWLRRALRLNPSDSYANDFLGTVYFVQGNLEAAVKCWNRVSKPQLGAVGPSHPLQTRPVLLDHALTFAPETVLRVHELLTSQKRVAGLGVFASSTFQLSAREDTKFDMILNLDERNGWGNSKWEFLLSTFRGVPYQTIYLDYFNLGKSAVTFTSLLRWDAQKRRLAADLSGPLHDEPKWRYRFGIDLRNENWQIRDGPAPVQGALNLRREAGSISITSFTSGRWDWTAGAEISHRDYRSVDFGSVIDPALLREGIQLKQVMQVRADLLRRPERRFFITSKASSEIARIWSEPREIFARFQGSASAHWLPQAEGDDYETTLQVRGGGIAGNSPFDELFMLGLERDNDLWLRAHIGTHDGRKGSAPLGDRFFLSNNEVDKKIYGNGLISVKLSPFLDIGRISERSGGLGNRKWLWDTGIQAKLRVLGVGVTFTYGKDLRTGNNVWYFASAQR